MVELLQGFRKVCDIVVEKKGLERLKTDFPTADALACHTQDQIAEEIDISQSRVEQIVGNTRNRIRAETDNNPPDCLQLYNHWSFPRRDPDFGDQIAEEIDISRPRVAEIVDNVGNRIRAETDNDPPDSRIVRFFSLERILFFIVEKLMAGFKSSPNCSSFFKSQHASLPSSVKIISPGCPLVIWKGNDLARFRQPPENR